MRSILSKEWIIDISRKGRANIMHRGVRVLSICKNPSIMKITKKDKIKTTKTQINMNTEEEDNELKTSRGIKNTGRVIKSPYLKIGSKK